MELITISQMQAIEKEADPREIDRVGDGGCGRGFGRRVVPFALCFACRQVRSCFKTAQKRKSQCHCRLGTFFNRFFFLPLLSTPNGVDTAVYR